MSVLALRDAIVAGIKDAIPGLKSCVPHGGRFVDSELDHYYVDAPAVFVTCLGRAATEDVGDEILIGWRWAAFIVARDLPTSLAGQGGPKHDVAAAIAEALAGLVSAERWCGKASTSATSVGIDNLYTSKGDERGVTFWAVTWTQASSYSIGVETRSLPNFLLARTAWQLGPLDTSDPPAAPPTPTDNLTLPAAD